MPWLVALTYNIQNLVVPETLDIWLHNKKVSNIQGWAKVRFPGSVKMS